MPGNGCASRVTKDSHDFTHRLAVVVAKEREARRRKLAGFFVSCFRRRTFDPFSLPASDDSSRPLRLPDRDQGLGDQVECLEKSRGASTLRPGWGRNVGSNRMPVNEAEDSRATITADQRTPVALNSSSLPVPPGLRPAIKLCVGQTTAPVSSLIVFARLGFPKLLSPSLQLVAG